MRLSDLFAVLVPCIFIFLQLSHAASPTTYLTDADKASLVKLITNNQKKDASWIGIKNTYYAVQALKSLNTEVPQRAKVCEFAQEAKSVDPETTFYQVGILEALSCATANTEKVQSTVKTALSSNSLDDLRYGASIVLTLQNNKNFPDYANPAKLLKGIVDKVLGLQEDGLFKAKADAETSILLTGGALDILGQLVTGGKITLEAKEKDKLVALLDEAVEAIFSGLESEDRQLAISDETSNAGNLRVTCTVLQGINSLSSALNHKPKPLTKANLGEVAEFLVQSKQAASVEDAYFLLEGLKTLTKNNLWTPLVVSVTQGSISLSSKSSEGLVKLRVTDVLGRVTTGKVFVNRVYPGNDKSKVLVSNQEVFPAEKDDSSYSFNILAAKPEPGAYTLEVKVTPTEANFIPVDNAVLRVKVLGQVTIADAQITISDSKDAQDIADGHKYKLDYPNTLDEGIPAEKSSQHLFVEFKVKSVGTSKTYQPHQAFVRISSGNQNNAPENEQVFVAKWVGKQYSAHILLAELSRSYDNYLEIIVGDPYIQNSFSWKITKLNLKLPNNTDNRTVTDPFAPKPEIVHMFRKAESRPRQTVSLAFSGAVAALFAFFLIGLTVVGANLRGFPSGTNGIYALGFQVCIGAVASLFGLYWFNLNMFQTLSYLLGLSVPTLFFANKTLNYLASANSRKAHAD